MKLVFMGTPDFAAAILKALYEAGHEITGVVTNPDKPKGRKGSPVPSDTGAIAEAYGLPVLKCARVRDPEAVAWIRDKAPDAIIVAAFGQIIPKEILTMPPLGCINVHASLLPAYRGAAPIQHCILDRVKTSGVTIMQMDEGLDTGGIYEVQEIPLADDETAGSLFDKMAEAGAELLIRTLPGIADGTVTAVPQPAESTTEYASQITKAMGRIDWSRSAGEIEAQIRGMSPWPSAYTDLDGKMLKIWRASVLQEDAAEPGNFGSGNPGGGADAEPGTILPGTKGTLLISCGEGVLKAEEVQFEGKKRMSTADFLRGYTVKTPVLGQRDCKR